MRSQAAVPITVAAPATTNATSRNTTPEYLITEQGPVLTQDFYLDTLFNPVWTSEPQVSSFAQDGTVVRPESSASEPHHAGRTGHLGFGSISQFQNVWKNTMLTKRDDGAVKASWKRQLERVEGWRQGIEEGKWLL